MSKATPIRLLPDPEFGGSAIAITISSTTADGDTITATYSGEDMETWMFSESTVDREYDLGVPASKRVPVSEDRRYHFVLALRDADQIQITRTTPHHTQEDKA